MCGVPCVNLLNAPDRGASYQFGIEGPWKVRAFLLDQRDRSTVMITLEDVDGNGFDREMRAAQPILEFHVVRELTNHDGGSGCVP